MRLTVWCRPNQFDCQSYLVNRSSLFNQSRCVLHLDLYLANCSTQRRKKYLAKQTAQVVFADSSVDGSGKLTCFKIIWHSFISHFGTTIGNKIKSWVNPPPIQILVCYHHFKFHISSVFFSLFSLQYTSDCIPKNVSAVSCKLVIYSLGKKKWGGDF